MNNKELRSALQREQKPKREKPSLREIKLKFWSDHKKNLLLFGPSGVGKTEIVREALEDFGYKLGETAVYYSTHANDFVGDPTKAEVIVFDDLNDPQAQKALDEVIGLKVWKGTPVTAFVWGAYQLSHDYDEKLHPNVKNKFELVVAIENRPQLDWFTEQFGETLAKSAIEWWRSLYDGHNYEQQSKVSPRMLANALKMYLEKGDIRDCLPVSCNVKKLIDLIRTTKEKEKENA